MLFCEVSRTNFASSHRPDAPHSHSPPRVIKYCDAYHHPVRGRPQLLLSDGDGWNKTPPPVSSMPEAAGNTGREGDGSKGPENLDIEAADRNGRLERKLYHQPLRLAPRDQIRLYGSLFWTPRLSPAAPGQSHPLKNSGRKILTRRHRKRALRSFNWLRKTDASSTAGALGQAGRAQGMQGFNSNRLRGVARQRGRGKDGKKSNVSQDSPAGLCRMLAG